MASYVITGSPGTGKHTIGRMLADRLGLDVIDLNSLATESGLCEEKDGVLEVDTEKLSKLVSDTAGIVIGHLAPYVVKRAESAVVLRRSPYELQAVYEQRGYSGQKTLENVQAEILGVIAHDAMRAYGSNLTQIDTTGSGPENALSRIEKRLGSKVDWLQAVTDGGDLQRFFPVR